MALVLGLAALPQLAKGDEGVVAPPCSGTCTATWIAGTGCSVGSFCTNCSSCSYTLVFDGRTGQLKDCFGGACQP